MGTKYLAQGLTYKLSNTCAYKYDAWKVTQTIKAYYNSIMESSCWILRLFYDLFLKQKKVVGGLVAN